MNKSELIDALAAKADVSKAVAGKLVDAFTETVTKAIVDGDSVSI